MLGIVALTIYCFVQMADPEFNIHSMFYARTWLSAWDEMSKRPLIVAGLTAGLLFDILATAWLFTRQRGVRRGFYVGSTK